MQIELSKAEAGFLIEMMRKIPGLIEVEVARGIFDKCKQVAIADEGEGDDETTD